MVVAPLLTRPLPGMHRALRTRDRAAGRNPEEAITRARAGPVLTVRKAAV